MYLFGDSKAYINVCCAPQKHVVLARPKEDLWLTGESKLRWCHDYSNYMQAAWFQG